MSVKFCPIASGSSGNSIYIGSDHTHILIDAGLSGKRIEKGLHELQIEGNKLDAIFITHEHSDHIKGAGILSRRFNIPIYATYGTWNVMKEQNMLGTVASENIRYVYSEENCYINDMCIRPYAIPHDASEPVGYNVFSGNCKITVATDIGHVTDTLKENIMDSDILLLESNHDVEMLKNGSYPYVLKKRIMGNYGHLSNETAGALLVEVLSKKLKHVFLGHLSQENNNPEIAYETVYNIINRSVLSGKSHLKLYLANRESNSRTVEIE